VDPRLGAEIIRTSVIDWLEAHGVAHKVHRHAPVRNAREAAAAGLDFDLSLLIKTLAYRTPAGWLLVAMRALDRVDHGALAKAAGIERRKLRFADDGELERAFGWEAGGAAPIPLVEGTIVLVDEAVLQLPVMYFGGGRRDLTIEAEPQALFGPLDHKTASIARSVTRREPPPA
jgi:Cys-tRNA(Pro)/Cys-tRNA(Cys) deacylase